MCQILLVLSSLSFSCCGSLWQRKVSLVCLTFNIQRSRVPRGPDLSSSSEGPWLRIKFFLQQVQPRVIFVCRCNLSPNFSSVVCEHKMLRYLLSETWNGQPCLSDSWKSVQKNKKKTTKTQQWTTRTSRLVLNWHVHSPIFSWLRN